MYYYEKRVRRSRRSRPSRTTTQTTAGEGVTATEVECMLYYYYEAVCSAWATTSQAKGILPRVYTSLSFHHFFVLCWWFLLLHHHHHHIPQLMRGGVRLLRDAGRIKLGLNEAENLLKQRVTTFHNHFHGQIK